MAAANFSNHLEKPSSDDMYANRFGSGVFDVLMFDGLGLSMHLFAFSLSLAFGGSSSIFWENSDA